MRKSRGKKRQRWEEGVKKGEKERDGGGGVWGGGVG